MQKTRLSDIRKRLLQQRGVELKRMTRKPVTADDLPSQFPKTRAMKYLELKHGKKLEDIIMIGNIYVLERKLGIDASTISKWRKLINESFWDKFDKEVTA